MDRDFNPWHQMPNTQWDFTTTIAATTNCMNNLTPFTPQQNNNNDNPVFLLPYHNPSYGYIGNSPPNLAPNFNGFDPFESYQNPDSLNPMVDLIPVSNRTNLNEGYESEMHEDTDEIDALLYSDSDEYLNREREEDEEEEEDSTGHSPAELNPKKRRLGMDIDASLMDTASSAQLYCNKNDDDNSIYDLSDAESVCVGGCEERETTRSGEEIENMEQKMKRKRIQETVGLLRKIIPGGKGKDAATILDEAISYLKSLKLKANKTFCSTKYQFDC